MIFNTTVFKKQNLTDSEFVTLLIIHSGDYTALFGRDTEIEMLMSEGYLTNVKAKNKSTTATETLRLSKEAKDFLRDLEIADLTDDAKEYVARIQELYGKYGYMDKAKYDVKACVRHMSALLAIKPELSWDSIERAVEGYLMQVDPNFVSAMVNLLFKPKNVYNTKFNTDDSKLCKLLGQ